VDATIPKVARWIPTALLLVVGAYFGLGAALYCWEGAYNVLQGGSPGYGSAVILVLLGILPLATGAGYWMALRRGHHSARSSLAFASIVTALVSIPVIVVRVAFGMGF
jgi:hypothetical protein